MVRAECGSLNLLATGGRGGELTMGGDPVSFNQRVVGPPRSPTKPLVLFNFMDQFEAADNRRISLRTPSGPCGEN